MRAARILIKGNEGVYALVSFEDVERIEQYAWRLMPAGYAFNRINKKTVYMHRLIMTAPKGVEVDHINGNKLDNRRENLRLCTRQQNNFNIKPYPGKVSQYKGVYWSEYHKKWHARIKLNGKHIDLGKHGSEIEAAKAYDSAALFYAGEFALLNIGGVEAKSAGQLRQEREADRLALGVLGYHGVSQKGNKFSSRIHFEGKRIEKHFNTAEEAAHFYDHYQKLKGKRTLNFPT